MLFVDEATRLSSKQMRDVLVEAEKITSDYLLGDAKGLLPWKREPLSPDERERPCLYSVETKTTL